MNLNGMELDLNGDAEERHQGIFFFFLKKKNVKTTLLE